MLKIKTIKSASKRFKKTSSGHIKYKNANLKHILTKKTTKRKRHLRLKKKLSKKDISKILLCIPYF